MSHLSMILTALMTLSIVIFIAPGIFSLNRGHVLRNIALWLAIFLGLALVFQNFGPGSPHPLFKMPDAFEGMNKGEALKFAPNEKALDKGVPANGADKADDPKDGDAKDGNNGEQGFTPPKEE